MQTENGFDHLLKRDNVQRKLQAQWMQRDLFHYYRTTTMRNRKTTVAGVIAGVAQILKAVGVDIPDVVLDAVTALAVFLIGLFAADKDNVQ